MLSVSIDDIKQDLVHYLGQIDCGETLLILQAEKPIAELKLISNSKKPRPFGLCEGEFIVPDNFDEPLPESIIREFEGIGIVKRKISGSGPFIKRKPISS